MTTCAWPDKACPRPARANGFCASHDVMWARRHGRSAVPKKRGPAKKTTQTGGDALTSPRLGFMLGVLLEGPWNLRDIARAYGRSDGATYSALRHLEASGLRIERTANGREVLRHVTKDEARRYLLAISGATTRAE